MSELVVCRRCKNAVAPALSWREFASGDYHLEAKCPDCARHLKFLSQTPEWLGRAPEKPDVTHEVEIVCAVCHRPVAIVSGEPHHA